MNGIRIGLPCVYPVWCFWIGVIFGLMILALLFSFVLMALKEKRQSRRRRRPSHKQE